MEISMEVIQTDKYTLYNGDCFDVFPKLEDGSIDLTLSDLPYGGGITDNEWDIRLPMADFVDIDGKKMEWHEFLERELYKNEYTADIVNKWDRWKDHGMWHYLNKLNKQAAATILTASGGFVGYLQQSNIKNFKYMYTWIKNNCSNTQNAKRQPMRITEQVLVFCRQATIYNPQGLIRIDKMVKNSVTVGGSNVKSDYLKQPRTYYKEFENYPTDVLDGYKIEDRGHHSTQKPVAMLRQLILTFTNESGHPSVVLDPCMGSGSTGVAAMSCGRYFVGIERDKEIFKIAAMRMKKAEPTPWQAAVSVKNQLKLL
jgi:site-specific DNA-methyltransferase (adenine-specific)